GSAIPGTPGARGSWATVYSDRSRNPPAGGPGSHSAIASPEPPHSFGKSFSFGRPSFMGKAFTGPPDHDRQGRQWHYPMASGARHLELDRTAEAASSVPHRSSSRPRPARPGWIVLVAGTETMATYTLIDLDDARIIGRQFSVHPTGLAAIAAGS